MELLLSGKTRIRELKNQFAKFFPFLKLQFYPYRHGPVESSLLTRAISDGATVAEVLPRIKEGAFRFSPTTTVVEFEQRLQTELGLCVQVFRKAGNIWLETVQTDNLSLQKQNRMGREASMPIEFNMHTLFL